jgi:hypothetical protein
VLRPSNFRVKVWLPAIRAAGLAPLRPHDLRHTAVALWMAAGTNPKEVSVRAGHTSVAFTLDRYGHLFEGSDKESADRMQKLFGTRDEAVADLRETPAIDDDSVGRSVSSTRVLLFRVVLSLAVVLLWWLYLVFALKSHREDKIVRAHGKMCRADGWLHPRFAFYRPKHTCLPTVRATCISYPSPID